MADTEADIETPEAENDTELKKPDLIDAVVTRTGLPKRQVKPAVEAAIAVIGETIAEGRGLNLNPMGKLMIQKINDKGQTRVTVCKLRQRKDKPEPAGLG